MITGIKNSIAWQTGNMNYNVALSLNNITGYTKFSFSGDQEFNSFTFKSGKIYDTDNLFVASYSKDETINISGQIGSNSYDYFINENIVALEKIKSTGTIKYFTLESDQNTQTDLSLYIGGELPNYTIEEELDIVIGQTYTSGEINNNNVNRQFRFYQASITGDLQGNKISGISNTGDIASSTYFIVSGSSGLSQSGTYNLPINFNTNFGSIQKNVILNVLDITGSLLNIKINPSNLTGITSENLNNNYIDARIKYIKYDGSLLSNSPITGNVLLQYHSGNTGEYWTDLPATGFGINIVGQKLITGSGYLTGLFNGVITGSGGLYNIQYTETKTGILTGSGLKYVTGEFTGELSGLVQGTGTGIYWLSTAFTGGLTSSIGFTGAITGSKIISGLSGSANVTGKNIYGFDVSGYAFGAGSGLAYATGEVTGNYEITGSGLASGIGNYIYPENIVAKTQENFITGLTGSGYITINNLTATTGFNQYWTEIKQAGLEITGDGSGFYYYTGQNIEWNNYRLTITGYATGEGYSGNASGYIIRNITGDILDGSGYLLYEENVYKSPTGNYAFIEISKVEDFSFEAGISGILIYNSLATNVDEAFDKVTASSSNYAELNAETGYIGIKYNTGTIINGYKIYTNNQFGSQPKSWIFEASQDNTNWTGLHTGSGITDWNLSEYRNKAFDINNNIPYTFYRINVFENNGYLETRIAELDLINKIDLISSGNFSGNLSEQLVGSGLFTGLLQSGASGIFSGQFTGLAVVSGVQTNQITRTIEDGSGTYLISGNEIGNINSGPYYITGCIVPDLTNTINSPTGIASAFENTNSSYNAFDRSTANWLSSNDQSYPVNGWIEYEMGSGLYVNNFYKYTIQKRNSSNSNQSPRSWTLSGLTPTGWAVLDEVSDYLFEDNNIKEFETNYSETGISGFRLQINEVNGGDRISVREIQFYQGFELYTTGNSTGFLQTVLTGSGNYEYENIPINITGQGSGFSGIISGSGLIDYLVKGVIEDGSGIFTWSNSGLTGLPNNAVQLYSTGDGNPILIPFGIFSGNVDGTIQGTGIITGLISGHVTGLTVSGVDYIKTFSGNWNLETGVSLQTGDLYSYKSFGWFDSGQFVNDATTINNNNYLYVKINYSGTADADIMVTKLIVSGNNNDNIIKYITGENR